VMIIALITKPGHADSGIGRYVRELEHSFSSLGHEVKLVFPVSLLPRWFLKLIHRLSGWDLEEFFNNYPIWIQYPEADIYHLTSQNLATIIHFRKPPGQTLITVHDLIPWVLRSDPHLQVYSHKVHYFFAWLALKGIDRINWVISNSHFSKDVLNNKLPSKSSLFETNYLGGD
jgi:glycosyltransferase involved in cell wall biosynthesis